ncbi:MAG: aldehyde ferredoxin oxidoreductase family protein [Candidatus Rifleibacteriota bacterium]
MNNYFMLDIDLDRGTAEKVDVTELFHEYIGGTGVATKLLSEMDPGLDPYDPKAPIIFAMGPFSSVLPVASKTVAMFKSPLTGNMGESHAGGRLALSMYGAGFHVIRIRGKSEFPCCLEIDGDEFKIHRGSSLKGMSSLAVERVLRDHYKSDYKRSVIRIGPAGERKSPIACVTVDSSRHFGRMGLGGVMGSKNVKAIIVSGGKYWKLENPGSFNAYYTKLYEAVVKSDTMKKYHDLGTSMNVVPLSKINGLPTRNFSQGYFESAKQISGEAFAENHLSQQIACAHCQCGCIHMAILREIFNPEEHMYKTFKVSYDHELIYAWGSNLSVSSSEDVLRALLYVEKQGWDAISMGVILAWAVEAFQKGLITQEHTDGLVLNFGDCETYLKVMKRIAARHNEFYSDLEKGVIWCAEKYGGKEFAVAFGKNEAPGYMTGLHAYLGYATGVRHSHLDSAGYSVDQQKLNSEKTDTQWTDDLYRESVWRMICNSLVICLFARNIYKKDVILEGLNILGMRHFDDTKLMLAARKIHAMKIKLKKDFGFSFDDLYFPSRLEKAITASGKVTAELFNEQVQVYKKLAEADLDLL